MLSGRIKRVVAEHGFGLIVDDAGMDWFFVRTGVRDGRFDSLHKGVDVRFAAERTPAGPAAVDVHEATWQVEG